MHFFSPNLTPHTLNCPHYFYVSTQFSDKVLSTTEELQQRKNSFLFFAKESQSTFDRITPSCGCHRMLQEKLHDGSSKVIQTDILPDPTTSGVPSPEPEREPEPADSCDRTRDQGPTSPRHRTPAIVLATHKISSKLACLALTIASPKPTFFSPGRGLKQWQNIFPPAG